VSVPFADTCPREFDVSAHGTLDPGGEIGIGIEAIRSCHSGLFRQLFRDGRLPATLSEEITFRVVVQVRGRHGSSHILSEPFEFPVRVCYGCLQTGFAGKFADFNFPSNPAQSVATVKCDNLVDNPYRGNTCNPGQDVGPILCCSIDGTAERIECPGTPRGKAPASTTP
jgi:hypothetical protein